MAALLAPLSTMVAILYQWMVQLLLIISSWHQQPTIIAFDNGNSPLE